MSTKTGYGQIVTTANISLTDREGFRSACMKAGYTMTQVIGRLAAKVASGKVDLLKRIME
jgi:hypothetical protein